MTRLLIGYDGSDGASAAITATGNLFPGAEALIATVYPPPPSLESAAIARIALPDAMIREGVQRMRDEAQERASTPAPGARVQPASSLLHNADCRPLSLLWCPRPCARRGPRTPMAGRLRRLRRRSRGAAFPGRSAA